jgi:hypothetical protein
MYLDDSIIIDQQYTSHYCHPILLMINRITFSNYCIYIYILVGGLEHEFYFSIYWECHHPN